MQSHRRHPVPRLVQLYNVGAFSDVSSRVGVAIVLRRFCRAWRLLSGWQTRGGKHDIQWAEAIGFELLVQATVAVTEGGACYKVHGDNRGVVEGWWNARSCNKAINEVFCRVHDFLKQESRAESIYTSYVASADNPADGPSREIYPLRSWLLLPIHLYDDDRELLINATKDIMPAKVQALREGRYIKPIPKPARPHASKSMA